MRVKTKATKYVLPEMSAAFHNASLTEKKTQTLISQTLTQLRRLRKQQRALGEIPKSKLKTVRHAADVNLRVEESFANPEKAFQTWKARQAQGAGKKS